MPARRQSWSQQSEAGVEPDHRSERARQRNAARRGTRRCPESVGATAERNSRRNKFGHAGHGGSTSVRLVAARFVAADTRRQIQNGSAPKLRRRKKNSSKNEQANSPIDHTSRTHRLMPGEDHGLRDHLLDDIHSVRLIAAVSRGQIHHARPPRPEVRAIARRRRYIARTFR